MVKVSIFNHNILSSASPDCELCFSLVASCLNGRFLDDTNNLLPFFYSS